jgi:hypothetical protein
MALNTTNVPAYRAYYNKATLTDALLKTYVTEDLVKESSEYVESLARNYGVAPENIADPTPYIVKMIAIYYSYMKAAWLRTVYSLGKETDKDSFRLKWEMYKQALDELLAQLNASSFTNGTSARKRKFPAVLGLARN